MLKQHYLNKLTDRSRCYLPLLILVIGIGNALLAQPHLIDSIEQRLTTEQDASQRMDLLTGLCRATLFAHGAERTKIPVARAKAHALATADSVGLGNVLLFQYMSDFMVEEGIPQEIAEALRLGRQTGNVDLELFAVYHLVEHYLYDKNDLVNTRRWLNQGHGILRPGINPKHRGNLYKDTALYHEARGNRDSMHYWLEAARVEFERVDEFISPTLGRTPSGNWDRGTMNLNQVLNYQGSNAVARGDFALAQQKLAAALAIAHRWQVDNPLSRTLTNIGEMQTATGDIQGAIASLSAALDTHKAHQNKLYAATTAQQIAYLFLLANDGEAASRFYQRAAADAAVILDTIEMINCQLGLAWSAQMQGDLPTAEEHLSAGEALAARAKDTLSQSYLRSERARQTYIAKQYEKAIDQFQEAIALHKRYQHENDIQTDYLGLARCYLALGQLEQANAIMKEAEALVTRVGSIHKQRETAELYAKIAETSNDLPLALAQHKRIQAINDSLNQQDAQQSLRREQVRQNVAEIELQNAALEREGRLLTQRNKLYLALALALLLLLAIGGYLLLRLRAARRALSATNEQLTALNATKDRFFGIIAHDLRSPIIALDGVGEQLRFLLDKGRNERATELADNVGHTAGRLSRLLDQLLSWALLQQGTMPHHPEPLALAAVVEEVMELFQPAATAKGVTLDYQVPAGLMLRADPTGLRTILRNLFSNAIKFTPKGGKVTVIGATKSDGATLVQVIDNGIGMSPTLAEDLLKGKGQTKQGTAGERGSGLGLRLVSELAQLHRASISLTSKSGEGSRFSLIFPG